MKNIKILFAVLVSLAVFGCGKDPVDKGASHDDFQNKTELGVYNSSYTAVFAFDEATCQSGYIADRNESRIMKDDMSQFLHVRLAKTPNAKVTTTLNVTTEGISAVGTKTGVACTVLKVADSKMWVWCDGLDVGFILPWR